MTTDSETDIKYMRIALQQAVQAADAREVPVGAVIVKNDQIIGKAFNQVELLRDPTAHAEMIAITQATSAINDWRLIDCTLYVTKEPCPMCAGAIVLSRIPRVVWGMTDLVRGGAVSVFQILQHDQLNHRAECVPGVLADECKNVIQAFFKARRSK